MPSEKILKQKKALVAALTEKLQKSCAGVVVSYKGINVTDDTKLRKNLRESGIDYRVVKNTMLRRAAESVNLEEMSPVLEGTTAIAMSENDHVLASKILCDFAKIHKFYEIKAGFLDGKVISKDEVKSLAALPSREVLISQVLGGLNAPITGLAGVLSGTLRNLVLALNAVAEKKQTAQA